MLPADGEQIDMLSSHNDKYSFIELGSYYANRTFYVFFVLRIISGPRVTFVQGKAFKPPGSIYY